MAQLTAKAGSRVAILDATLRRNTNVSGPAGKNAINAGKRVAPSLFMFELLDAGKCDDAVGRLAEEFDYVIVDAPPVTDVPYALTLASKVQSVVIVTKSHRSRTYSIGVVSDFLRQANAHVAGAVISHSSKSMTLPARSSDALRPPLQLEWPVNG